VLNIITLLCLDTGKHPGDFQRKEINFKPQRQLLEKLISVSTIGDSIDSKK